MSAADHLPSRGYMFLDPGTARAGVAVYTPGRWRAGDCHASGYSSMHEELQLATFRLGIVDTSEWALVSEWPTIRDNFRVAAADVERMQHVVLLVEGWGWHGTFRVPVAKWAGTVPKNIRAQRTFKRLSVQGRLPDNWDRLGPDARDAIGLGLWWLG